MTKNINNLTLKYNNMPNKLCKVIISEYNYDKIKRALNKLDIPIKIDSHNFGLKRNVIVYDGSKFRFENFVGQFNRKTDLNTDIIVKRGSDEAPGLFKLGTLEDNRYKDIRL